ncbi:MAG: hypothetical protein ABJA76_13445 [Mucilaginibacter sp.]
MNILKLDNGYDLAVENTDKKARLVVYNNGVENVCRKSTLKTSRRLCNQVRTTCLKEGCNYTRLTAA